MKKLFTIISLLVLITCTNLFSTSQKSVTLNAFTDKSVSVNIIESTTDYSVIEFELNNYKIDEININSKDYLLINIPSEGSMLDKGMPELPVIGRSVMIPASAKMHAEIISSEYNEFSGHIAPSKGSLLRNINPADIPFEFSDFYQKDSFFPESLIDLGEPYILREIRGISFRVSPFSYNPALGIVRCYNKITLKIYSDGFDTVNILQRTDNKVTKDFSQLYKNHFLNYESNPLRYQTIEEQGSILVISHPSFTEAMQPFVNWKNQKGIPTTMVTTNEAGTTHAAIKTYIQNYWNSNPELAFVQLVGDAAQIPTATYAGGGSDPSYVMLAGNDHYPDMFIGRFSAENIAHVQTQVERTIYYERDIIEGEWLSKAMGVASNEGPGDNNEYDHQHLNVIRNLLLAYTYNLVDQFYQPSATATQVTNALNEGRSFANYTGHGTNTTWSTTGFSNSHINALTNDNKLPFIVSVACVNGNFTATTCFAEAWLRATNNSTGAPTGAVNIYASSINQAWRPPMRGQDVIVELLVADEKNTIGGLFFNGSSAMIDAYPTTDGYNTMRTWHIFGDASLQVRTTAPVEMTINAPETFFIGMTEFTINTDTQDALTALYNPDTESLLGFAYTDTNGNATITLNEIITEPVTLTLTTSAYNKITDIRDILVVPNDGPYVTLENVVNQMTGNNSIDFSSLTNLEITLSNIGSEPAENLSLTLTSNSSFVQVNNPNTNISVIPAESIHLIDHLFQINVDTNIQNASIANLVLIVTDNDNNEWTIQLNLPVNAPILSEAGIVIIDTDGNNNGNLDPGETVQMKISFENTGNLPSLGGTISVNASNPLVSIELEDNTINSINPNEQTDFMFTIVIDETAEYGSLTNISYIVDFQSQILENTSTYSIGLVVEDFESGNFNAFDWQHSGNQNWTVVTNNPYEGNYSAKSGTINHNQTTSLELNYPVTIAGEIEFAIKVSSESNYDFLKFYINNELVDSWSGNLSWTVVNYPVLPGNSTFKWTYSKDGSVSSGDDCAWIDYIIFPTGGSVTTNPQIAVSVESIDMGTIEINEVATSNFTINNSGNANLTGTITLPSNFTINNSQFVIAPSQETSFILSYQNTTSGIYNDEIIINSNDSSNSEIIIPVTVTVTNDNNEITQIISLIEGWNILSSYVNPENGNMMNVFNDLINSDMLIKVQDQAGNSLEYLDNINQWVNSIGELSNSQSYRIKVEDDLNLYLTGSQVELPLSVNLLAGWNLISYPYSSPTSAITMLQSLIDNNLLEKMIDEAGNTIEVLPEIGLIDNINYFEAGKGYAVKVNQNTTIEYPNTRINFLTKNRIDKTKLNSRENVYYQKNWSNNGWKHFNLFILVDENTSNLFTDGDEIALFDGENCVANVVYSSQENYISLIASLNDELENNINGYTVGNNWSLRVWLNEQETEILQPNIEIILGNSNFEIGQTTVIKINDFTSVNDITVPQFTEISSIYPNPFNPTTNIRFNLNQPGYANIEVFNVKGQKIKTLISDNLNAGTYTVTWNGTDYNNKSVASGIYFTRLQHSNQQIIKKMILIK